MRHLKIFEEYTNEPKYKVGDYIQAYVGEFRYTKSGTDVVLITNVDVIKHEGRNIYQYEGISVYNDDNLDEYTDLSDVTDYFLEDYIIRKLTKEEAEIYKNANKYNI